MYLKKMFIKLLPNTHVNLQNMPCYHGMKNASLNDPILLDN
jgi:hypothetical protein